MLVYKTFSLSRIFFVAVAILLLAIILLLTGCGNVGGKGGMTVAGEYNVKFEGVTDDGFEVLPNILAHGVEDISEIDEKLAFNIGVVILNWYYGEDKAENLPNRYSVYEPKGEGVFVVCRLPREPGLGGDHSVAISKKDGSIVRVWAGY
jgi:hypothetical protein